MKPLLERYLFRKCKRKWTKLLKWLKKMNEEPHPVLHGLHDRTGHIAVAYGSKVLVWGGYFRAEDVRGPWEPELMIIFDPLSGVSTKKITTGQVPPFLSGATAQVIGSKMYILCGFISSRDDEDDNVYTNTVFSLCLRTWSWCQEVTEPSQRPIKCDKLVSWTRDQKIFIFGGFGTNLDEHPALRSTVNVIKDMHDFTNRCWNDQLAVFDTTTRSWSWPTTSGSGPTPRAAHAACVIGSKAFVFGGRLLSERTNDLFCLDMDKMEWSCLKTHAGSLAPLGRSWHSLTLVNQESKMAVLYGGYGSGLTPLGDCWLLDLKQAEKGTVTWTNCHHLHLGQLLWHQAVALRDDQDRFTGQVALIGGVVNNILFQAIQHPKSVLYLDISPQPLLHLALKAAIKGGPSVLSQVPELPNTLQDLFQRCQS